MYSTKIKNNIAALIAGAILLLVPIVAVGQGSAQDIQNSVCSGSDSLSIEKTTAGSCTNAGTKSSGKVDNIVELVINIFSMVVGVIAVIMIIVGGFKFITAGGDSGKVTSARSTIIYALIGLVIVALAQVIVRFVLSSATK